MQGPFLDPIINMVLADKICFEDELECKYEAIENENKQVP